MMGFAADLRMALRTFRSRPGFAAAVLVTLALGIGASTAMFSVLNAVLLEPLPQQNAPRVVRIYQPNEHSQTTGLSPLEIVDVREQASRVFEDVVEYHAMPFTFVGRDEAERLQTGVVSANFFDTLGVRPLIGRTFLPGEDQPGADPVLLLSFEYWQREHGGDPDVVGRTFEMNDRTHEVVGVLPPFPQYPNDNDVYMPSSSCPFRSAPAWAEHRAARGLAVFGLLRDGVTADAALADLRTVTARLKETYPEAYAPGVRYDVALVPLADLIARPARTTVVVLLLATLLLLGIVCSNVGNLFIVSTLQRNEEMAVRLAFGATRARLVRRLAAESGVLAATGGAAGLGLAFAGTKLLAVALADLTPRAAGIAIDANVLLFAIGATAMTAVTAALLPLSALRRGVAATLRDGAGRGSASGRHVRVRNALIVLQVAVSLVLLTGAGLLGRTLAHLQSVETGFDPDRVTTARLDLNWTTYDSAERRTAFFRELELELGRVPGIEAVGIGSSFPLNDDPLNAVRVTVAEHEQDEPLTGAAVAAMTVSPGYFDALGVPLLQGRVFATLDGEPSVETAVIVTRALAERYWPDGDPIGRRISVDGGQNWARIVGVAGDVRLGLDGDFDHVLFVPHDRFGGIEARVLVRGTLPPAAAERALREAVAAIDAQQPVTDIRPLSAHRGERLAPYRVTALLMSAFALVALGVTACGLGGAIAFSVAERTREIGIRVAIGARPVAVLRMLLGQVVALAAAGCAIGAAAAWYGGRYLGALTAGVEPGDPLTFVGVVGIIVVVTALAALAPVRRALRVDPLRALQP